MQHQKLMTPTLSDIKKLKSNDFNSDISIKKNLTHYFNHKENFNFVYFCFKLLKKK